MTIKDFGKLIGVCLTCLILIWGIVRLIQFFN